MGTDRAREKAGLLNLTLLLLAGLFVGGCARLPMTDARTSDGANATFRYLGMRKGASTPDYSSINASVLGAGIKNKSTQRSAK